MAGVLGARKYIEYKSENGTSYVRQQRLVDATAVGNTVVARNAFPSLPRYLRPRRVHCKSASGLVRAIAIGDPTNALYLSGSDSFSMDGENWATTGRSGENDRGGNTD